MTRLSGRVPETGTAIEGATVFVIDTSDPDPLQWDTVAWDTTDANGEWSVSGLASAATERYHAVAQYDGGTEFVNFESLPYLSTPADVFAPETALTVGTPTPTMSVGSAIPDPVVNSYSAKVVDYNEDEQVSTVSDQVGSVSFDQATSYQQPIFKTGIINNHPAFRFDGSNDLLSDGGGISLSEPFALYVVGKIRSAGGSKAIYGLDSSDNSSWGGSNGGNWELSAVNGDIAGSGDDTDAHIFGFVYDADGAALRVDGSPTTGDVVAGGFSTNTISIGDRLAQSIPAPLDAGQWLLAKPTTSSDLSDVESYLSDGWDIALA